MYDFVFKVIDYWSQTVEPQTRLAVERRGNIMVVSGSINFGTDEVNWKKIKPVLKRARAQSFKK